MAYSPSSKNIQMAVADEEFACPLCCEVFEEPKLLPNCAHSFCKACLHELILRNNYSSRVSCPVCRESSNVPRVGVQGFATNTLLVRLIENIPGKKDRDAVSKALAHCKEEIERNKNIQDSLKEVSLKINKNKEHGLKLKREVSEHAQQAIDSIREWEKNTCEEVDSYLEEICGTKFHEWIDDKWQTKMDEACNCVKTVEELLSRNNMSEILEMKQVVIDQLNGYSKFPSLPTTDKKNIQCFQMEFQKTEVKQDLGKVVRVSEKESSDLPSYGAASRPLIQNSTMIVGHQLIAGQVCKKIPLRFEPYRFAICPHSGDIALLWEARRQVHLYSSDGEHKRTIFIKFGDLWDVGFTISGRVVVVNRTLNRLLMYDKDDGYYIPYENETPRDCLKFTDISVDSEGRLIVTSAKRHVEDDDIVPCIVVYNNYCEQSCMMFGRRHLINPDSRAVYQNRHFYVADDCDNETVIRCFSFQGSHVSNIILSPGDSCLSTVENSNLVVLTYTRKEDDTCFVYRLNNGDITDTKQLMNPHLDLRQAVVASHTRRRSIKQAEIYDNVKAIYIVGYFYDA